MTFGRVYVVHPNEGEKYFLRMLLYFISCATCFEELRTFNNNILSNFKETCIAQNLFLSLEDATVNESLYEIQQLLEYHGKHLSDFLGMPIPTSNFSTKMSRIIMDELPQNCDSLSKNAEVNQSKMNQDQKEIFNNV